MRNHQFSDGQLVDYISSTDNHRTLVTILERLENQQYRVKLRSSGDEKTVSEDELEELEN